MLARVLKISILSMVKTILYTNTYYKLFCSIVGLAYIHTEINFILHGREHFWRIKLYRNCLSLLEVDCIKDFLRVSYVLTICIKCLNDFKRPQNQTNIVMVPYWLQGGQNTNGYGCKLIKPHQTLIFKDLRWYSNSSCGTWYPEFCKWAGLLNGYSKMLSHVWKSFFFHMQQSFQ